MKQKTFSLIVSLIDLVPSCHVIFSTGIDLNPPKLSPIRRSWLLQSEAFCHEPHEGCFNPHFKQFLTAEKSLNPPTSAPDYENLLAATWLRLSCPTSDGISLYHGWVAAGCHDEPVMQPYLPLSALESSSTCNVMGLLCWDSEIRAFMDAREAVSFLPQGGELTGHSVLRDMIRNFDHQLIGRMANLLAERKRLMKKISLLIEAVSVSQSILDTCCNV